MAKDLFGERPRRKRRVMMHVIDHGADAVEFECKKCGYSDWYVNDMTVAEAKRGVPCPKCNEMRKETMSDLPKYCHECGCIGQHYKGCASSVSPVMLPGEPMETAPKDGSSIEILFRHVNHQYAPTDEKPIWEKWCNAYWTDFNGGGWIWHGIAGIPVCWRRASE